MALPINENFEQANAFPNTQTQPIQIPIAGAPGKSAYDMAVAKGFTGTQAEWMASLQGEQGTQGETGNTGERGETGHSGSKGEKGEAGEVGPIGPQGPAGEKGERGETGPKGETGERGEQGLIGPTGLRGIQGDRGERGEIGLNGPRGLIGEKGDRGEVGPVGPKGETGNVGPAGGSGPQGPVGFTGSIGPEGPRGPSGATILGTVNFSRTAVLAITAGLQTWTLTGVPGILANDNILLFPVSPLPAGYAIHNVVATGAGALSVTYTGPLLALGASFSIPCRVVALR